jgi:hypothetical protein
LFNREQRYFQDISNTVISFQGSAFLGSKVKKAQGLEAIRLEGNKARTPESLKAERSKIKKFIVYSIRTL